MKKFAMILAAGLFSLNMSAGTPVSEALPFAQLDFNPASIAMGNTHIECASHIPHNPYFIGGGVGYENYMPELSGTKYLNAGAASKINDNCGVSLSFVRGTGEEITGVGYTPFEILVNAGFGFMFSPRLAVGLNVKYAKEHLLKSYSNTAVLVDITGTWKFHATELTAGVTGIGEAITTSTGKFPLPTAVDIAAKQVFEFGSDHALTLAGRADYYFAGHPAAGAGVEYCFSKMVFVRAGYHYGGESIVPSFASAGAGLWIGNFYVDAAYAFASDVLDKSFSLRAGVRF